MNVYRYRLVFARNEKAKNMSHHEQIKFLKNFLKQKIPYIISDKKISFGPAISCGYESFCEYIDLYLYKRIAFENFQGFLDDIKENGFELIKAFSVPVFFPSIENSVEVSEFEILLSKLDDSIVLNANENNKKKEIIYEKNKNDGTIKRVNLKDFIFNYEINKENNTLILYLKHISGMSVKPEVVLKLFFGYEGEVKKIIRKNFYWIDSNKKLNIL